MRKLFLMLVILLPACGGHQNEPVTTSVDVNESDIPALLAALNELSEDGFPIEAMNQLAVSTPMDQELQDRYKIAFNGSQEEILYHTWREQSDWIHLYFSSTSTDLIASIENVAKDYARNDN